MIRASFFWLVGLVCLADWLARIVVRHPIAGPRFWRLALAWQWRLLVPDRKTVRGRVERVNRDGVHIDGTWYNYGRTFRGNRPAAGAEVELALVYSSKDQKWFIQECSAVATAKSDTNGDREVPLVVEENPTPQEPATESSASTATPQALKYAEDLALGEGWTSEDLESLAEKRFKKPFAQLSPREASKLIEFFGGYKLTPKAVGS